METNNNPTTTTSTTEHSVRRKYHVNAVMILAGFFGLYISYFLSVIPEVENHVVHHNQKGTTVIFGGSNHDDDDDDETNKNGEENEEEISSSPPFYASVLTPLALQQIESYRNGTGLMLNIHVTHHGGTTFCGQVGRSSGGISPGFACMGDRANVMNGTYPNDRPWTKKETEPNIAKVRPYFHMISWEFGQNRNIPLSATDWESPNLLSVYITRDPMSRLLSGMGPYARKAVGYDSYNFTKDDWWNFAKGKGGFPPLVTNNFALHFLAGNGCCQGADTPTKHLDDAKTLLNRFSIILDIACLGDGIKALAQLLNITLPNNAKRLVNKSSNHSSIQERIGHDDVYEYLLEKNKRSIEFYEWSKSKALIKCRR
jgi:hypothetical protein